MNHGNTQLEDNLILHLAKGTDHILSVFGSYRTKWDLFLNEFADLLWQNQRVLQIAWRGLCALQDRFVPMVISHYYQRLIP